ncbi:MAG: PD40 domain-containing protein [Leptonema sp. (in: Bacteria)]|nr:PD40 domain-containing protein [Leptonema sp. (in: bacteria)]
MVRQVNTFADRHFFVILLLITTAFYPSFGQHKLVSRNFEWKTLTTARFVIHYPDGYLQLAITAAKISEETADRLQFTLRHNLSRKIPIFLYASFQDFQATNLIPFTIDEGTGGFTDFAKRRVALPFSGNYHELQHVLSHEIVHAYQFDILSSNMGAYPLWLMEGMAEYLSLGTTETMDSVIRDLMIHGRMVDLLDLQFSDQGYMNYPGGQFVMHFIAKRWGVERFGMLLRELKKLRHLDKAFRSTFDLDFFQFAVEYRLFVESLYAKARLFQEDRSNLQRISFRYFDGNGFHYKPAISSDGKITAFLTYQSIFPTLVIRRLPEPGLSEEKQQQTQLVLRYLKSADYEEWQPTTTRLSFHPDRKRILIPTRNNGKLSLAIVNIEDGSLDQLFSPPFDLINDPVFSPDGKNISFVGSIRGRTDLFILNTEDGAIQTLTDDLCSESTPRFSKDGESILYSSCSNNDVFSPEADLFRVNIRSKKIELILKLQGNQDSPVEAANESIIFISDHQGVRNLYRLSKDGHISAVTALNTDVLNSDIAATDAEIIVFSRREEGAIELYRLAAPAAESQFFRLYGGADSNQVEISAVDNNDLVSTRVEKVEQLVSNFRQPLQIIDYNQPYQPWLTLHGSPFIFITGASDSQGNTSVAALGYAQFQDLKGDHQIESFISYQEKPVFLNGEVRYRYLRYKIEAGVGLYSYSGVFAIFSPIDFSLNNIIYNPFFRLSSLETSGFTGWLEAKLNSFSSIQLSAETGRDEFVYRPSYPEEQNRQDVYRNRQNINLRYLYDSTVYSIYGPLDGQALLLAAQIPVRSTGRERELYQYLSEYRLYHLFEDNSVFAFRALAAMTTGKDAKDYPYRIGGYYTIRGYDFQEFEGRYAALINVEYRFTFIERLIFGFPTRWSPGLIRSSVFFDAGAAFDNPDTFRGIEGGRTRDLRASVGIGLHWANFLWFMLPGALMKIEWASPYDGRRTLPISQWQGRFSVGIQF